MKHRILVVEDELRFGKVLESWLESKGHQVVVAKTLEEGFIGIATEPLPDVVLLDIRLGNQNSLTLVHWARKQRHLAQIPIAAMTTLATFKNLKSIGEAGCDTCFTKPADFQAVREYLAGLGINSVSSRV